MNAMQLLFYALAAGLTLSGLTASLLEMAKSARAGFRPPFVERDRLIASLGTTMTAGPYMLGNEALAAWRLRAINRATLTFWMALAIGWALASGILIVELALAMASLFQ